METGDIIDYEVLVSQTKQDVKAVNVVITDELPSCVCSFWKGSTETSQEARTVRLPDREKMDGSRVSVPEVWGDDHNPF